MDVLIFFPNSSYLLINSANELSEKGKSLIIFNCDATYLIYTSKISVGISGDNVISLRTAGIKIVSPFFTSI